MIRKSEYFEQTEKYLNAELSQPELSEFEAQMAFDADLGEEVNLHQDVEQAIGETDIIDLRKNLNKIVQHKADTEQVSVFDSFSFGLSEELSSFQNMDRPVTTNDILNAGLSFPKIHLYQHKVAGKENIHQFYKEQFDSENISEEETFSSLDEELFTEVQNALEENDIADMRANLKQIARSIPSHRFSFEDLDNFISGQIEADLRFEIEEELELNNALAQDLKLSYEVDLASGENDIMQLRATLNQIQKTQFNSSARIEEIEQYLYNELPEDKLASFEGELSSSTELREEVKLVSDIDQALKENDIMQLRSSLQHIAQDISEQQQSQRSFVAKFNPKKVLLSSAAAFLILLLGVTGLLNRQLSPDEIYRKFYNTYQTSLVSRSESTAVNQALATALVRFNDKDYTAALELLQQVNESDPQNAAGHFYAGAAFQEAGNYSRAIDQYQVVISNEDNLFTEQAQWYIGLCYLQTNDNRKAYKQFKKIAEIQGFYQQNAKEILRKMKHSDD